MFHNIPDDSNKLCRMSQHCKSSQIESAYIATFKCIKATTLSLLHDMKLMSHDKSVDLAGVLSCRMTFLNVCNIIFSAYEHVTSQA